MRYLVIVLFFLINLSCYSQIINLGEPEFKGNIDRVVEQGFYQIDFTFDSLSRVDEKKSYRNNKLLEVAKYSYLNLDTILITKESINGSTFVYKSHFDSNKRLIKYEIFSPKDSIYPISIKTNFNYANGYVQNYNRLLINHRDTTLIELYRYEYNKDYSKIMIRKTDNKSIYYWTTELRFDKMGKMISILIDNNVPWIGGVKTWIKSKPEKLRIDYKYDLYGNWIKAYSVTWLRRYVIKTREIKYK